MKKILIIVFLTLAFVNYRHLNIGFLSIYSIDEYAFHGSLLNMYRGLISLDVRMLFSFDFYSYGFGFFFLNLITALPFIAGDNIEMTIYLPRIITSLFAVGSLWFIYRIAKLYIDEISSILVSLIVLSMPGYWKNAFWFHPDWMMTFFITYSIYLFAKDNWRFEKQFLWGNIMIGLAISTKIQAVTFYPFIFLYIFYDNFSEKNVRNLFTKLKLFLKSFFITITVFIISNPYIINPRGLKAFIDTFNINMQSNETNHGLNIKVTIIDKIENAIDFYYLNTFIFSLALIISAITIFSIFDKKTKKSILPIIGLYFIVNILYLFLFVNKDWQHYYLPLFVISTLLFIYLVQKSARYKYFLLGSVLIIQIAFHVTEFKSAFTQGYDKTKEMPINEQIRDSNMLLGDLRSEVNKTTHILIEPYFPFDFQKLGLHYENIQIIYSPLARNMFDFKSYLENSNNRDSMKFKVKDFIIISKKSIYFDERKVKSMVNNVEFNESIKIIDNFNKGGELGYVKFAENDLYYIWRKK